jgi:hypothetical protein
MTGGKPRNVLRFLGLLRPKTECWEGVIGLGWNAFTNTTSSINPTNSKNPEALKPDWFS